MAIPDWLARLQAQGGAAYTDPTSGQQYIPMQTNGATGPQDGYASIAANTPNLGGFGQHDYSMYDGQGNATGTKQLGYTDDFFTKYMPYVIAALATGGVAATAMGAGGAAGAAGAGAGAGAGGEGLATGGFLGEAPWTATGGGALDFGATGATGAGAGGGAAGGIGGGATAAAPAATAGSPLSSLLSSIGGTGGSGSLLGLGATALGGLLGSKGAQKNETTTKNLPDYMQASITGPSGLLAQTDALRNAQMQPGAMQGYADMQNAGRSLLSQPIAGNGVGKVPYPTQFGFKR